MGLAGGCVAAPASTLGANQPASQSIRRTTPAANPRSTAARPPTRSNVLPGKDIDHHYTDCQVVTVRAANKSTGCCIRWPGYDRTPRAIRRETRNRIVCRELRHAIGVGRNCEISQVVKSRNCRGEILCRTRHVGRGTCDRVWPGSIRFARGDRSCADYAMSELPGAISGCVKSDRVLGTTAFQPARDRCTQRFGSECGRIRGQSCQIVSQCLLDEIRRRNVRFAKVKLEDAIHPHRDFSEFTNAGNAAGAGADAPDASR